MGSTLIHGATVLTVDAENTVHTDGWVAIRDGRIDGVGPQSTLPPDLRLSTRCSTFPATS